MNSAVFASGISIPVDGMDKYKKLLQIKPYCADEPDRRSHVYVVSSLVDGSVKCVCGEAEITPTKNFNFPLKPSEVVTKMNGETLDERVSKSGCVVAIDRSVPMDSPEWHELMQVGRDEHSKVRLVGAFKSANRMYNHIMKRGNG